MGAGSPDFLASCGTMLPNSGSPGLGGEQRASAGPPRSALWLDHVHPYEHDFLTTAVFCPVVDVPRFGDDASGPKGLLVPTLTELGEPALQDVRERGALLVAMEPSNSSWVECNRAQPKLVTLEIW